MTPEDRPKQLGFNLESGVVRGNTKFAFKLPPAQVQMEMPLNTPPRKEEEIKSESEEVEDTPIDRYMRGEY